MIKADPNVVRYRWARILYYSGLIIMVVSFALLYLTSTTFSTSFKIWSLIVPFFLLLASLSFIQKGQYWKRFEQRRIRASQGDQSLLAGEQPALDEAALSLPLTIQSRTSSPENFFRSLIGVGVITMITVGVIGFLASSTSIFSPSNVLAFVLGGLAILVLTLVMIVVMVFLALVLSRTDQRIELTEQRMTVRQGGRVHSVAWDEARLFAIEGAYGVNHALSPSIYQLASANDILKWTYQKRRTPERSGLLYRPILAIKPTTPYSEYNRQMQALLSFVVARTGLPLYDLREDLPKGGPKD